MSKIHIYMKIYIKMCCLITNVQLIVQQFDSAQTQIHYKAVLFCTLILTSSLCCHPTTEDAAIIRECESELISLPLQDLFCRAPEDSR